MKVYITYFRYDRDENYEIYRVDLNRQSSVKDYKENQLPNFLGYGPDDVSYLILKEVDLTPSEYSELLRLSKKTNDYDRETIDFMIDIHDGDGEEIFFDSGDTIWEVLDFFIDSGVFDLESILMIDEEDYDDDELRELCQEKLFEDDDLFDFVLKTYIQKCY